MMRRISIGLALLAIAVVACSSFEEGSDASSSSSGGPDGGAETDAAADAPAGETSGCVDTSSDPSNCGSCGHDCLGGACTGGSCQPVEIGHTSGAPVRSIAVSGTRVFWMTSAPDNKEIGSLYSCAKGGCPNGVPETVFEDVNSMGTLAGDGTNTWASFAYGANRVEMFGPTGGSMPIGALSALDAPFYMEVQSGRLFLVNHIAANGREIVSWKPGEEAPTPEGTFMEPGGMVVNTFHASFTTDRIFLGAVNTNYIATCARGSCSTWEPWGSPKESIGSMTNDDERLYWIENSVGTVTRCTAAATCTDKENVITAGQLGGEAFMVSYAHASKRLAILTKTNEVVECDPANCSASKRILAKGAELDRAWSLYRPVIAADDRSVYYATVDGATHRLMRIAR